MVAYSLLDLCPIVEGSTPRQALLNSLDLAQHAEDWGYSRYWVAEHHNMPGVGSAATSVVIGYIAAGTSHIRVGAGGVMLPNHSPLVIAEQFGTLEALYPGRIELGLGRAPGGDQATLAALRRDPYSQAERFPNDVQELQSLLADPAPKQRLKAVPGYGSKVPLWLLGSSTFGARLAAKLGLPYAFASHFAPAEMFNAIALYRQNFKPSAVLSKPYVCLSYNIIAAETDAQARYLASSMQRMFVDLSRGLTLRLQPPQDDYEQSLSTSERRGMEQMLSCIATGSAVTVKQKIEDFIEQAQPDELMLTGITFDHAARVESFDIGAQVMREINEG